MHRGAPGCTVAPALFNLYFSAVVSTWRSDCDDVDVLFCLRRKLIGDQTAKSWLSTVLVMESQFSDDLTLYTSSRDLGSIPTNIHTKVGDNTTFSLCCALCTTQTMKEKPPRQYN